MPLIFCIFLLTSRLFSIIMDLMPIFSGKGDSAMVSLN
nr:MAG TPA: hypothetical protein [Caudoviricetes sp.]